MTQIRVRLCDADRARYEVDDDLLFDIEALKDMPAGELEALEEDMGVVVATLLPALTSATRMAVARRAVVFFALHQASKPVAWKDCQPRLLRAEFVEVTDTDPPAGSSASSSEAAPSPVS